MKTAGRAWLTGEEPLADPHGKGERAVQFVKRLRLFEGARAGQTFPLARWQERIIRRVYGDTDETGRRNVETVFILLPRGNGKTTFAGALGGLHLFGPEKDAGGQVIAAAADREQASIAYRALEGMIAQDRTLKGLTTVTPSNKTIRHDKSRSFFKAISHEAYTKHGMSVSCLIADEIHAWPTRELWDVLRNSMGKRDNPLSIVITTAGEGVHGLAYELYAYAKRVASGEVEDPTFLPILFEPEPDADWQDEEVWRAVNPAIEAGFRSMREMRNTFRQALEIPAQREAFKRYYLNIWSDGAADPWLDMDVYDAGSQPIDLKALHRAPCWLGVDLSSTDDLTAIVAAFPQEDGDVIVRPWFFAPEEGLRRRQTRDQVPYLRWAEEGHLIATPGEVIDYEMVLDTLAHIAGEHAVQEVAMDRWNATKVASRLQDMGLMVAMHGQGFAGMSPAVKETQRLILSRSLRHGGHPVLRWCFQNCVVDQDPAGNLKFNKARSAEKIDGAVACAMAVHRAASVTPAPYEDRGLVFI